MKNKLFFVGLLSFAFLSSFFLEKTIAKAEETLDTTGFSIVVDTTYIEKAVVGTPISLKGEVRNEENRRLYDQNVIFTVESGNGVDINNNVLSVNASGAFSLRATMENDPTIFDIIECEAFDLTFSNLKIKTVFSGITVYTQPISMQSQIDIEGIRIPTDAHKEICYDVVSGPASIFCGNYLKIEGTGKVIVKAYSFYDNSVTDQVEFDVIDPDENLTEYNNIEDAIK